MRQYGFNLVDEAHAQHFVGFVEDDTRNPAQVQRVTANMILDPARRADDGMHPAAQLAQLRIHALTAVHRQDVEALQIARIRLHRLGHLDRELPGRGEDKDLGFVQCQVKTVQRRQRECRGFAGAGLRLTDDIVSGQQRRDGGALDRRRGFIARVCDGAQ